MVRAALACVLTFALVAIASSGYAAAPDGSSGGKSTAMPVMVYTPKPEKKPPDTLQFRRPVLFVIVLGGNPDMRARVAVAMAKVLGRRLSLNVVPEADWGIKDYVDQCKSDPSTAGAFIVQPPGYGSREIDSLVALRKIATVEFNAMISTCPQFYELHDVSPRPTPGPPEITWVAKTSTGEFGRTYVQFLPFAVLTSIWLAFSPQRLYQTATTRVIPAPSPVPPGGYNSNVTTTSATTLNASGTSTLQNSVVTQVGAAALDFGQKGDVNQLTMRAAEAGAWEFMQAYQGYCENSSGKRDEEDKAHRLPYNSIDQATFCAWLHPFVAGKITYKESPGSLPQAAHGVPVTLTLTKSPGTIQMPTPIATTHTDCLGTYHFTNVQPGADYEISVGPMPGPLPKPQFVTVRATGEGSRQIADFTVSASPASPCRPPPASVGSSSRSNGQASVLMHK